MTSWPIQPTAAGETGEDDLERSAGRTAGSLLPSWNLTSTADPLDAAQSVTRASRRAERTNVLPFRYVEHGDHRRSSLVRKSAFVFRFAESKDSFKLLFLAFRSPGNNYSNANRSTKPHVLDDGLTILEGLAMISCAFDGLT